MIKQGARKTLDFLRKKGIRLIIACEGHPFLEAKLYSIYVRRVMRAGVPKDLVNEALDTVRQKGLRHGLATLSLLRRVCMGETALLPVLLSRLSSQTMMHLLRVCPRLYGQNIEPRTIALVMSASTDAEAASKEIAMAKLRIEAAISKRQNVKSRNISFDHTHGLKALQELMDIFERHGKRFFLSSGTLLGAIREKGFIASDYDIDVGIFREEMTSDECVEILSKTGFNIIQRQMHIVKLKHTKWNAKIDIFFYNLECDLRCRQTDVHAWWHEPFDLMLHDLQGHSFFVPSDVEKYLTENYGNWKYRVVFYDFSYDTPNRTYKHNLEGILYLYGRARNAFRNGWRYFASEAATHLRDYFGIDYTHYLRRAVRPHSLPLPIRSWETKKKRIALVISDFARVGLEEVTLLDEARQKADMVVVAIPAAKLVASRDGEQNEIPLKERLAILRGLRCVDRVVVVENDEALKRLQRHLNAAVVHDLVGIVTEDARRHEFAAIYNKQITMANGPSRG